MEGIARRWSSRLMAIVAIVALSIPITATAVTITPLGANLLKDAGAEQAAGTDGTIVVPVPAWTSQNGFTAAAYGATNAPTTAEATRIGGGAQMFYGGGQPVARARQTVVIGAATRRSMPAASGSASPPGSPATTARVTTGVSRSDSSARMAVRSARSRRPRWAPRTR